MKKIVLFEGEIETQEYFSYRLKETFEALGHEVFVHNLDVEKERKSLSGLMRFVEKGNTVMVCFNFHGITPGDLFMDETDGSWFWDDLDIPCINIVVDHPFYYHRFIKAAPKKYYHASIDRYHDAYMKRHFPEVLRIPFLPLAGTQVDPCELVKVSDLSSEYQERFRSFAEKMKILQDEEGTRKLEKQFLQSILTPEGYLPLDARPIDVIFTGNYSIPTKFDKYICRLGEEYEAFYRGMIAELLAHPQRTLEDVAQEHLLREIPEITEAEFLETMGNLIFIDLYVRSVIRGKAVQSLVDAGLKVAVFGGGWEDLECEHPENIINAKGVDSITCLKYISLAKVSLNVMPWFKDGAHDRVFNTVLNGALLVSDESIYLNEILKDGENCILYDLNSVGQMPERVKELLARPERMQEMISAGYQVAIGKHTWKERAEFLSNLIEHMFEK